MKGKLRTLVVDDSVAYRLFLKRVVEGIDDCELVGVATDGEDALEKIQSLSPDFITLDIEMPKMNGLEVLSKLRESEKAPKVLVVSSAAVRGSASTIEALSLGAFDFITKPITTDIQAAQAEVARELGLRVSMVKMGKTSTQSLADASVSCINPKKTVFPCGSHPAPLVRVKSPIKVVVIGVSTGGPQALIEVFTELPSDLGVPILIVQHMPAVFTHSLAESLDKKSHLNVKEAVDGEALQADTVYIAPGGTQMKLVNLAEGCVVRITDDEPELFCKPSVNYLFESVAEIYGSSTLAIIMTGLGADGTRGLLLLKAQGATVLAQDKTSCSVWGMPGAAVGAGVVDLELPLKDIAKNIHSLIQDNKHD